MMDTIVVHPREVFRLTPIPSAATVVLMHNHSSGDVTPSDADINVTRDLIPLDFPAYALGAAANIPLAFVS